MVGVNTASGCYGIRGGDPGVKFLSTTGLAVHGLAWRRQSYGVGCLVKCPNLIGVPSLYRAARPIPSESFASYSYDLVSKDA